MIKVIAIVKKKFRLYQAVIAVNKKIITQRKKMNNFFVSPKLESGI